MCIFYSKRVYVFTVYSLRHGCVPCSHTLSQTDALEFQAWQRKMAAERSRGQFFKSLYQADETPIVGEDLSMLKVLDTFLGEDAWGHVNWGCWG